MNLYIYLLWVSERCGGDAVANAELWRRLRVEFDRPSDSVTMDTMQSTMRLDVVRERSALW